MNALIQNFTNETTAVAAKVFICGCCKNACDMEDHMGDNFQAAHAAKVQDSFDAMVCFACADDFEAPEAGDYTNPGGAYDLYAEGA